MTLNEPLIRKIVEYIEHNPDEWDQENYGIDYPSTPIIGVRGALLPQRGAVWSRKCGTTACFAGIALTLTENLVNTGTEDIDAAEVLGFTEIQAHNIFHWYGDADYDTAPEKLAALKQHITEVTGLEFD